MKTIIKKEVRATTKHEVIIGTTRGQPDRPNIYQIPIYNDIKEDHLIHIEGKEDINPIRLNSFYHRNLENEPEHLRTLLETQNTENGDLLQGIIFPKDGKDWKDTRYFVCNKDESKKYIDLKKLPEGSAPSCYKTNKVGKKSELDKFLSDKKEEEEESHKSNYIPKNGKILNKDQLGQVLHWIKRWYILSKPDQFLYRAGVSIESKRSILYLLEKVKYENESKGKKKKKQDKQDKSL